MTIAFVFPGQGSQTVGMMNSFAQMDGVRETFAEASQALGQDLWKLVEEGPSEELNLTINTQPAMLAAGVALYRAWKRHDGSAPAVAAGHSLGEYSALVVAGSIEFRDAVALVRFRAQAMQEAVPAGVGAMAAILGIEDAQVVTVCEEAAKPGEPVEAANFNSPAQVVIAGNKAAVERAMELAKSKGAKRAVMLPMSVPSHCSLMRPAAEHMRARLESVEIRMPGLPVIHNATVREADSAQAVRDALVRQLYQPVRWVDTIRAMVAAGATRIVECGPGRVLAGLNKRIAPGTAHLSFADEAALRSALAELQ